MPTVVAQVVSYLAPAPIPGGVSVTFVDAATAHVWSASAAAFVAAPPAQAPAGDSLFPLASPNHPDHPATYTGLISGVPAPSVDGGILVYIHSTTSPQKGPIDTIPVSASPPPSGKGTVIALTIQSP
jgi:hypothetical protein